MTGWGASWAELWATPLRLRIYLGLVAVAAITLPLAVPAPLEPAWDLRWTVAVLIGVSVLNVEISRLLSGGLSRTDQPHKALSAWAFGCAMLLPTPWLLVVVPITYVHARWRGLRVPLWKWVWSGFYLVLCGYAAGHVRHALLEEQSNWMDGNGQLGFLSMMAAAAAFLALETLFFCGSAFLNRPEDEVWLRATLRSWSFYATETGVLLVGGLFAAVWTGGTWFALVFVPIFALAQRAALHVPLRERAQLAADLAARNEDLQRANQFKIDLIGMLGHEIGNPVAAIRWNAELGADAARDGDLAEVERVFAGVERNTAHLGGILRNVLSHVSREHQGLVALPEECPVLPRLEAAVLGQPPGKIPPEVSCPEDLTAWVQPGHLDQILANLLTNAAKYAGGATSLTAARRDGAVEITVADKGPGVPAEFRERLFLQYSRDPATGRQVSGTGLGLFISRELARANGGQLAYRDGEGEGATFVLTLPLS